jgi:hypothetical protein
MVEAPRMDLALPLSNQAALKAVVSKVSLLSGLKEVSRLTKNVVDGQPQGQRAGAVKCSLRLY